MRSRSEICAATSQKLSAAISSLSSTTALVGLDGFVDEIIAVVDTRKDASNFEPVRTIGRLAAKIGAAAGESSNYELFSKQIKLGGNGPIMANALAAIGLDVTYVGNLGFPTLHSVFEELSARAKVLSIAEPAHTDALEFDDGKLMLGKMTPLAEVTWDHLIERVGRDRLTGLFHESRLIGLVNWTMLPFMSEIWKHLLSEVFPAAQGPRRTLFIDLADPEKRTHHDILEALELLTKLQVYVDVTLGLNLKESGEIVEVLGLPLSAHPEADIAVTASNLRAKLGLSCVVVHPRRAAAAAVDGESAMFHGPFVDRPLISTGAGDHFNAGFAVGRLLGLDLEEALCAGVSTSGYYVRTTTSPTAAQLAEFAANLPEPQ
jgi:sugar/nucleoside kinase (ribokinase family)